MNTYQVVFEAEVYVIVDADSEEEAEARAQQVAIWEDVVILDTIDVYCVAGECED